MSAAETTAWSPSKCRGRGTGRGSPATSKTLVDSETLGGVALIGVGVANLVDGETLLGVALIGVGVAIVRQTTLMSVIRALTRDPNADDFER